MELNLKLLITITGVVVWCIILVPFYVIDWDERRRERIRQLCTGDALVNLWKIIIDVAEDGSCEIERVIDAINLADKREYYELESWTDPEVNQEHETFLKNLRKIKPEVVIHRKGGPEQIIKDREFVPDVAQRINRIIHVIPLTTNGEPLKPWDRFIVRYKEKLEKGSLKMTGDYYQHRVRHLTERLEVSVLLPKGWRFPKSVQAREKLVQGEVKSPTIGEWIPTVDKPKIEKEKDRIKISWLVEDTKLLHTYRLSYHALEKAQ